MVDRDEKASALIKEIDSFRQRIADREHSEGERKQTEEIFLDLFNATEEVALLMDREGIILVANKNGPRLYGPVVKLPGSSIYDLIPRDRIRSGKERVKTVRLHHDRRLIETPRSSGLRWEVYRRFPCIGAMSQNSWRGNLQIPTPHP
jgi:PAS domain-containing protein